MGNIRRRLKIELMSDLCAGSGYSYAGIIDSDVVYDDSGLPQIPARRLKGCMREAAQIVCPEAVEALFGKSGDNGVKGIVVGNACIEDHEAISEALGKVRESKQKEAPFLSPQNILEMYTGIRAQTKICGETGTAEENTLRYTRVVGQYDPRKEREPLCFFAEIEFDEAYKESMERIAKAVRNLGMNRNRGLGSVRCSLGALEDSGNRGTAGTGKKEGRVCVTYVLRNRQPLLMSSDNTAVSDSCISGKSILGSLAGSYLRREDADGYSETFRELFLDGSTVFTDANLTFPPEEGREKAVQWPDYYPAPMYLNRLKKTKVLVNLLAKDRKVPAGMEEEYDLTGGNLPKKLKTHYVHEASPNVYHVAEPEREIYYHNSRQQNDSLYSQEAIKEGQYFRGRIFADGKYADLLTELLVNSRLCFGKSRTAQYGRCALAADVTVEPVKEETVCVEAGMYAAVVFCSDALFLNGDAAYTVRFQEVKRLIGERLQIPYDEAEDGGTMIQTREVTGYSTVWNLKRQAVPAVKAGSVFVYKIAPGKTWRLPLRPDQAFVGERNLEGYGHVRIVKCSDMVYGAAKAEKGKSEPVNAEALNRCRPFLGEILVKQILERMIFLYTRQPSKLGLTAATVGRLDLMLQESMNAYRARPEEAFRDFCRRIGSIKRKKEQEEAFRLLDRVLTKNAGDVRELDLDKMTGSFGDGNLIAMREMLREHSTDEEYRKRLTGIWGRYMETILTYHKYLKKHEGGGEKNGQ